MRNICHENKFQSCQFEVVWEENMNNNSIKYLKHEHKFENIEF